MGSFCHSKRNAKRFSRTRNGSARFFGLLGIWTIGPMGRNPIQKSKLDENVEKKGLDMRRDEILSNLERVWMTAAIPPL
jgi:hypothetical protein